MGTPAYSTGRIQFNSASPSEFVKKVEEWVKKANNNEFAKDSKDFGDYEISIGETGLDFIDFEGNSGRDVNLEWQMERFENFVKSLPESICFESSIYIMGDGRFWERDN